MCWDAGCLALRTRNGIVSFPIPNPRAGKGLVTFECFIGCALSAKKFMSCDSHLHARASWREDVCARPRPRARSRLRARSGGACWRAYCGRLPAQLLLVQCFLNMSSDTYTCVICRLPLPVASKRRRINPVTEANADVHEFFIHYVVPGYVFSPSDSVKYMCLYPCFADIMKALKHHLALQELLGSVRGQLSLHPSLGSAGSAPDSPIVASSQPGSEASSTCTPCRNKFEVSMPINVINCSNACKYSIAYDGLLP